MQEETGQQNSLILQCSDPGWPTITIPWERPADPESAQGPIELDARLVYKIIKKTFSDSDLGVEAIGFNRSILLEEGVLEVPFLLRKGNLGVAMYVYAQSGAMEGAHFSGVQDALQRLDYMPPVYYAPHPLPAAQPIDPLRSFGLDLFREVDNGRAPNGTYAMWWPTDDESLFCNSKTHRFIGQFCETISGIESYFLAKVLRAFDLLPPDRQDDNRATLPTEPWVLPLLGPELTPLYFVADAERGIQFYLHVETTSRVFRERLWKHLLGFVRREREYIIESGLPLDEYPDDTSNPLNWWLKAERAVQQGESQGAQMEYFGGLEALLENAGAQDVATSETSAEIENEELAGKRPDRVSQVLYTVIILLIVVWTVLAGITLFNREPGPAVGEGPPAVEDPVVIAPEADEMVQPGTMVSSQPLTPTVAQTPAQAPVAVEDGETAEPQTPPDEAAVAPDETPGPVSAPPLMEAAPVEDAAPDVAVPPEEPLPAEGEAAAPDVEPEAVELVEPAEEVAELTESGALIMRNKPMLPLAFKRSLTDIQFAARMPMLLVVERDLVRVLDLRRRGQTLRTTPGTTADLSADGSVLASHLEGTASVLITEMATGRKLHTLAAESAIRELHVTNGESPILVSLGDMVRVFDLTSGAQRMLIQSAARVLSVRLSADLQHLYALEPGALVKYSLETGAESRRLDLGSVSERRTLAVSASQGKAFIADDDRLLVVELESMEFEPPVAVGEGPIRGLAVSFRAPLVAVLASGNRLWLWEPGTEDWQSLETPFQPEQVGFSGEGGFLALRDKQRVVIWDVNTLRQEK